MISILRIMTTAILALGLLSAPACADELDDAKANGQVGERIDGYLGVVAAGTSGDVRALVDEINAERRARYEQIAKKQGAPVEAVAQIAGKKLIERTPTGQYVLDAGGQWRRK